jgi:hypothetical protein
MTTRQICISIFNTETKKKFTSHTTFLGHVLTQEILYYCMI